MHSLDILFHIVAPETDEDAGGIGPPSRLGLADAVTASMDGSPESMNGNDPRQETANAETGSDGGDESDDEPFRDDEWPPLQPGMPPDVGDMLARIPERFESLLLSFRNSLYSRLDIPQPWGSRLEDSASWLVLQRGLERSTLLWLRTSFGENQLPQAWSGAHASPGHHSPHRLAHPFYLPSRAHTPYTHSHSVRASCCSLAATWCAGHRGSESRLACRTARRSRRQLLGVGIEPGL